MTIIVENTLKDGKQLSMNHLAQVYSALLEAANNWYNFGLAMGITANKLDSINSNNEDNDILLRKMLAHWLRSSTSRTWTDICNGLRDKLVGLILLAERIEREYCSEGNFRSIIIIVIILL